MEHVVYEKALDNAMKDASMAIGEVIKFGKSLKNSQVYFDNDLVPLLQDNLSDDRLLNTYSISLFAAEKVPVHDISYWHVYLIIVGYGGQVKCSLMKSRYGNQNSGKSAAVV